MAEFLRLPDSAIVAVRCSPELIKSACAVLKVEFPLTSNCFNKGNGLRIAAMGPDDWLVIAESAEAGSLVCKLESALSGHHCAVIDVSGNRVAFRLGGQDARTVLARGCSLDLDSMSAGDAAFTIFARVPTLLLVESETTFILLPRRSFAPYLEDWFAVASAFC